MELYSRYGEKYELRELLDGDYLFELPKYSRVLYGNEDNTVISALDPPGGPMIFVGSKLGDREITEIVDLNPQGFEFILKTKKEG